MIGIFRRRKAGKSSKGKKKACQRKFERLPAWADQAKYSVGAANSRGSCGLYDFRARLNVKGNRKKALRPNR